MRRNSKAKLDVHAEIPCQMIPENLEDLEELAVTVADSSTVVVPREKRKEDAGKPLYIKRI